MLMHGLHWAWALPMQADLQIDKLPPACVSSNQNLMFLSDMHSFVSVLSRFHIPASGLYCATDFTAWDSYSALYQWENSVVAVDDSWDFWGMVLKRISGGSAVLIIAWVCLGGKCLPVLREKISAARNMEKEMLHLHEATPFSVLFSLSASCSFCPHSTAKLKARAWMNLRGL